ncbi:MAG: hypothetical protein COA41_01900 [Sphingopyxis sp.]|nr:MAG: hypothetical protein COA41_01900 [Sphingopyxis sp.]
MALDGNGLPGIASDRTTAVCLAICHLASDFAAAVSFVGNDSGRRITPVQKGMLQLAGMTNVVGYRERQEATMNICSGLNFASAAI